VTLSKDWLGAAIAGSLARAPPAPEGDARTRPAPAAVAAARAHLGEALRQMGLAYGTPTRTAIGAAPGSGVAPVPGDGAAPAPGAGPRKGPSPEAAFLAMVERECDLAIELAGVLGVSCGAAHLAALFAHFAGNGALGEKIDGAGRAEPAALRRIGAALWKLGYFAGNPAMGLPLHNALAYADARAFGRLALRRFARGPLDRAEAARLLRAAAAQKALMVEAIAALLEADRPRSRKEKAAIARQLGALGLPRAEVRRLKHAAAEPRALGELAGALRGREVREFAVVQVVMAALVDGAYTRGEVEFVARLARAVGVSPERLRAVEAEVAEFYARHRAVVDAFTVAEPARGFVDLMAERINDEAKRNLSALLEELRKTRELGQLLSRAARGETLDEVEKAKVRAQLLDLAKAIPALSVFAMPGGALLLPILIKVLPFNLLPSAFAAREEEAGSGRPDGRPEAEGRGIR
jgi:hypothetical protein